METRSRETVTGGEGIPATSLEELDPHGEEIWQRPLGVSREELKWLYIKRLDRNEAEALLRRVLEAREKLRCLSGPAQERQEASVLRGVLAMAENDLLEIMGQPAVFRVGGERWSQH